MKKPMPDTHTCATCESYQPINPGDMGHCYCLPPVWIEVDGVGKWACPVVAPHETCRMYLRRLNS